MCVVSMVGDFWNDHLDPFKKYIPNQPYNPNINIPGVTHPTKEEFDILKREVEIMKKLFEKAKIYDEKNNEPDCEIDEKMETLRKIAKLVGIDLDEVLKSKLNGK